MKIEHLFDYHPYRGGNNPRHNGVSAQLIKFKNGDPEAIRFFTEHVTAKLQSAIPRGASFSVATVPSSTAGKAHKGFGDMVRLLKGTFPEIKNSANLLRRISTIEPLHKGGQRTKTVHQNTLSAVDTIVNGDKVVLLDDVTTSGNSLTVAAGLLKQNGADVVLALALCKTVSQ